MNGPRSRSPGLATFLPAALSPRLVRQPVGERKQDLDIGKAGEVVAEPTEAIKNSRRQAAAVASRVSSSHLC